MKCNSMQRADYFEITFNLSKKRLSKRKNNNKKNPGKIKPYTQYVEAITFIRRTVTVNLKIYVLNLCYCLLKNIRNSV